MNRYLLYHEILRWEKEVSKYTRRAGISDDAQDEKEVYLMYREKLMSILSQIPMHRVRKERQFLETNRPFYGLIDSQDKVVMVYSLLLSSIQRMKRDIS